MTAAGEPLRRAARALRRRLQRPPQAAAFDEKYYLAANPDVARDARPGDALQHYLEHGWREGRRPNTWFDPLGYLQAHPDVRASGEEPLLHHLQTRPAGERSASNLDQDAPDPVTEQLLAHQAGLVGRYFDAGYYVDTYGAVEDPLRHFLLSGWRQGHNPSASFDTTAYLEDNPDVAAARLNPFVHFHEHGRREGRRLRPPKDPRLRQLELAEDPYRRARSQQAAAPIHQSMPRDDLATALRPAALGSLLLVSVSHDDYAVNTGGVQQVIARERDDLAVAGVSYLHLSPALPLLVLADATDPRSRLVSVRLDGERLGIADLTDLAPVLAELTRAGVLVDGVVHSLLGHAPEVIGDLLASSGVRNPVVWAHDFTALCSSYALMRNEVEHCGAPPPSSTACAICCHGAGRADHLSRMSAFVASQSPVVLAPSRSAAELLSRRGFARTPVTVVPPARLVEADGSEATALRQHGAPLRVAHLGTRSYLKGWHVFARLAQALESDPRYAFLQVGLPGDLPPVATVRGVPVQTGRGPDNAMIETLAALRVDVVVNWSLAAETFSFTTYEALAAGAHVVARRAAGNVWPAVQSEAPGQGVPVDNEADLVKLFTGDELPRHVASRPGRRRLLVQDSPTVNCVLARRQRLLNGLPPAAGTL